MVLENDIIYLHGYIKCRNLNLGLTTKARSCKVVGQEEVRESCRMFSEVQESVRE